MPKTDIEEWLINQSKGFLLAYKFEEGNNHFVHRTWVITDPNKRGLSFEMSINDNGEISLLELKGPFTFGSFNVAEGFSSEFILQTAESLIKGTVPVKRSKFLNSPSIHFQENKYLHAIARATIFQIFFGRKNLEKCITNAKAGYTQKDKKSQL